MTPSFPDKSPLDSFKPSESFWSPQQFGKESPLFKKTLSIARDIPSLSSKQQRLLKEASSRPWDASLQIITQSKLLKEDSDIFKSPPLETQKSISKISKLIERDIIFLPDELSLNYEAEELLRAEYQYLGNSASTKVFQKKRNFSSITVAQSGGGKTYRAQNIFLNNFNSGRLGFINAKPGSWLPLLTELSKQGTQPAFLKDFRINPIAPFGSAIKSIENFVQLFSQVEEVPIYSCDVLYHALDTIYKKFGAYDKKLPLSINPTITDLNLEIEKLDPKKFSRSVTRTLMVRLQGWQRQFGDYAVPWDLEELGNRTVLFSLSHLNQKSSIILVDRIQTGLFSIRENQRTQKPRTMLLQEEGRLLYSKSSQMAEDICLLREENLYVDVLVQSCRNIVNSLIENSGRKSLGPIGDSTQFKQLSNGMGISPEQCRALESSPVGTFIDRYLYGWPHPILIRMPYRTFRSPTEEERYQAEHALDDLNAKTKTREEAHQIEVTNKVEVDTELSSELKVFLLHIHKHPFLTTTERLDHLGIPPKKSSQLTRESERLDLVIKKRIPLGKGGSPILLALTTKAQKILGLPETNKQIEHTYAELLIQNHCQKFGANAVREFEGVDVKIEFRNGIKFAVEIEFKNQIEQTQKNILRNSSNYNQTIIVTLGEPALRNLKKKLIPFLKEQSLSQHVLFRSLGMVNSDNPIWELRESDSISQ